MLLIIKNSNSVGEKQVLRGVDVCVKVKMVKVAFYFFFNFIFFTFPDISNIFGKVIIANWWTLKMYTCAHYILLCYSHTL